MKKILITRHAEAVNFSSLSIDFSRPLSDGGISDCELIGNELQNKNMAISEEAKLMGLLESAYKSTDEAKLATLGTAIEEFNIYLNQSSQDLNLSTKAQFMICKSWYSITSDFKRDQTNTYMALDKLQYYIEKEIMTEYVNEIEEMILNLRTKLAKKDFFTARLYIKLGEFDSANIYYYSIINNYYDTRFVNDALINIALLYFIDNNNPKLFLGILHRD